MAAAGWAAEVRHDQRSSRFEYFLLDFYARALGCFSRVRVRGFPLEEALVSWRIPRRLLASAGELWWEAPLGFVC